MYLKWEAEPQQDAGWTIMQPAAGPALESLLCQLSETNTIDYRRNNELREDGAVSWNRKLQDKMRFKVQEHKGVTELMSFPHPYV